MAKLALNSGLGNLKFCFIKGEGRNSEIDPASPARMVYTASVAIPKDGELYKDLVDKLTKVWEQYKKEEPKALGKLKTSCIKDETIKDPSGAIDPDTDKVRRLPTGNALITFYTATTFKDGKQQLIKKFDGKGNNITAIYDEAEWTIGDGSTGILYGTAIGNVGGGNAKITVYLTGVQIAKLVKYEGTEIELIDDIGEAYEAEAYEGVTAVPKI